MLEDIQFFEDASEVARHCLSHFGSDYLIRHYYIEEADAYRFFVPIRGGAGVIVARDGSFLFANSSVSPLDHHEFFIAGMRTDPVALEYWRSGDR